jgi:hypothetical protein
MISSVILNQEKMVLPEVLIIQLEVPAVKYFQAGKEKV